MFERAVKFSDAADAIERATEAARLASIESSERQRMEASHARESAPLVELDASHPQVAPVIARTAELERLAVIRRADEAALLELPAKLSAAERELASLEDSPPTSHNYKQWRAERLRLLLAVDDLKALRRTLTEGARRGDY